MFFTEEIGPRTLALHAAVTAEIVERNGELEDNTMYYAAGSKAQSAAFAEVLKVVWTVAKMYSLKGAEWDTLLDFTEADTDEIVVRDSVGNATLKERSVKWYGLDSRHWKITTAVCTMRGVKSLHVDLRIDDRTVYTWVCTGNAS
jgi:hypothetical protein